MKRTVLILILIFAVQTVFCISPEEASKLGRPSVAVVLSGGETRAFGHIELLETLETLGIPVDAVYGSSSGSLIAGLYCAGYSPREIRQICEENYSLIQVFDLNESPYQIPKKPLDNPSYNFLSVDITDDGILNVSGIFGSSRIVDALNELLSGIPFDTDFDDLPIRFVATTVDALSSELLIIKNGSIAKTIAASMAMPLAFSPIYDNGVLLEDGGFTDNLPVDLARADGYDIVITEDLNSTVAPSIDSTRSISGVVQTILRIVVDRELIGRDEISDVYIYPEYGDKMPGLFSISDVIYSAVRTGIDNKMDELKEVASLFEEGKYVKDPNRVGDYTKRFGENKGKYIYELQDWTRQLKDYTVVSVGINGFDGFDFSSKFLSRAPSIRVGFYETKVGNSRFGLDVSAVWRNNGFELNATAPFELTQKLYLVPGIELTLSNIGASLDLQYTDRESFSFSIGSIYNFNDNQFISVKGIFADNLKNKKNRPDKYSVELSGYAKPVFSTSEYDIALSAACNFTPSSRTSVLLDMAGRKSTGLDINGFSFGGKYMSEFIQNDDKTFLSAGLSSRLSIVQSLFDIYTELNLRADLLAYNEPKNIMYCSLSVGIDSPVGDARIGLALAPNKDFSVFFDFR